MYNDRSDIKIENFNKLDTNQGKLEFLVLLATLAPSAHNTQPWLFKIENNSIAVLANFERELKYSDQQHRQLFISVGAAIANLEIASKAYHLDFNLKIYSQPQYNIVAIFKFNSLVADEIDNIALQNLISRKSNRLPLSKEIISSNELDEITAAVKSPIKIDFISDDSNKVKLQKIVADSVEEAFSDSKFTDELSNWIKPNSLKYRDGMPGYTIGVPKLISYFLPFAIKHFDLRAFQKRMHKGWLDNAPIFGVVSSEKDEPYSWVMAGYYFEKMALASEAKGIRVGIMGGPVEIGSHYKSIQEVLRTTNRPQMFFRIGYGPDMPNFSPRIDYKETIIQ